VRPGDDLAGALKLRWLVEDNRLVPFGDGPRGADMLDVLLSTHLPASMTFGETWRMSALSR
jgi:hypothetical protein